MLLYFSLYFSITTCDQINMTQNKDKYKWKIKHLSRHVAIGSNILLLSQTYPYFWWITLCNIPRVFPSAPQVTICYVYFIMWCCWLFHMINIIYILCHSLAWTGFVSLANHGFFWYLIEYLLLLIQDHTTHVSVKAIN